MRHEYDCIGEPFPARKDAAIARDSALRAAAGPPPNLALFRCWDGHWHYREEWKPQQ